MKNKMIIKKLQAKASELVIAGMATFLLPISFAEAATCTAATETGKLRYAAGVAEFCDGTNWVSTKNAVVSTCAAGSAGTISYTSSQYQFCDGANWYSMKNSVATACVAGDAGKKRYSSNMMQFCDGTNWYNMAAGSAPAPTSQAILRIGTSMGNNGGGTASLSLNKPMVYSDTGNFMLAVVTARTSTTTITPPTGWTQVPTMTHGTGLIRQAVFYRVAASGEPASYSFTLSSAVKASGAIFAYTGVDTSNPFAGYGGTATATSASITAPSVTLASGDENSRLITFFGLASDDTITTPQGVYNYIAENASTGGGAASRTRTALSAELIANAGATGTRVATAGSATDNVGQVVVLRRAGTQPTDPCSGKTIGQACTGGSLFAGTFRADRMMILPGNCTGGTSNPTCDGAVDPSSSYRKWGGTSGTNVLVAGLETNPGAAVPTAQMGDQGTLVIINDPSVSSDSAGHYCANMVYGGYDDWYLPSRSEWAYIYCKANVPGGTPNSSYPEENPNCAKFGGKTTQIAGFSIYAYNSTTEAGAYSWNSVYMNTGSSSGSDAKTASAYPVRCVRRY